MPFPPKAPKAKNSKNKGSKSEMLPSRNARAQLTGGDPMQRTMNNYAKATPGLADQSPMPPITAGSSGPLGFEP